METADVVIAGAGIIGLSLALDLAADLAPDDLASRRLKIIVLERTRAMSESSWAAAGMLAAAEYPPQLAELARFSLAIYPNYLTRIEQLSGKKVPLRTKATILTLPAEDPSDPALIHKGRRLTHAELHAIEPGIRPQTQEFWFLDEASLDPRDLCAALPAAVIAAGVRLLENTPVISIDAQNNGVVVQTPTAAIAATHFINCAGAWAESPALGRLPHGHPKIAPRKGQITTVRLRGPFPPNETLTHVLRTPDVYLVPRGDGRITIGATIEHAGFDKTVEPHAIAHLLKAADELYPPIADAEVLESWAGLRPGSSDDLPLIGPAAQPNTWIASGHFRNGILLAPATARVLSQLIRGENPTVDLTPFAPNRMLPAIGRPLDRLVPACG